MTAINQAVEEFGHLLMQYVHKVSLRQCQLILRSDGNWIGVERWRAAAAEAGGMFPAELVIVDVVDTTVFEILRHTDDQEVLHLWFTSSSGQIVDLLVDGGGELGGWYVGAPSWRTWYSKERIPDKYDLAYTSSVEYGVADSSDDPAPNLDDLEMPRRAIEELGILLVRHVRDVAIQSCDLQLLPHSETPMAKRWRKAAIPHGGKVPPEVLIPDCVDETIFTFLRAIDKGLLPLSFTAENGETVDLTKVGNLAERYIEPGGWRDQFSKERINTE
jgi:hypothetical protein